MGHFAQLETRCYIDENNEFVASTTAYYKDYKMEVCRYYLEKNEFWYQFENSHFVSACGWKFEFPGEKYNYRYYGGKYVVEEHPLEKCDRIYEGLRGYTFTQSLDTIKSLILSVSSEYKYLFNKIDEEKYPLSKWTFFELIQMWKKHPLEVECLSQKGLYTIALNNNLYKLTDKKKKSVLQALKLVTTTNITLKDIQSWLKMKDKLTLSEYMDYKKWNKYGGVKDSLETFRYCKRKNISCSNYHDMLSLASSLGHNIEDDYWKYPNDPNTVHNNLVAQKSEIDRLRREEEAKKESVLWDKLEEIKKKVCKKPIELGNGYVLFFPTEFKQYDKAATTLHQCIVTAKYYKKCAEGKSMIFMIWKDNEPSSTYEVDYNKNIIQAYADEWGYRKNNISIKPSEYEMAMFNKFLETFKPRRLKEYI